MEQQSAGSHDVGPDQYCSASYPAVNAPANFFVCSSEQRDGLEMVRTFRPCPFISYKLERVALGAGGRHVLSLSECSADSLHSRFLTIFCSASSLEKTVPPPTLRNALRSVLGVVKCQCVKIFKGMHDLVVVASGDGWAVPSAPQETAAAVHSQSASGMFRACSRYNMFNVRRTTWATAGVKIHRT